MSQQYCSYYQAQVERKRTWLFAGILRSFEHLVFERTLDKEQSIFEFFVPSDLESYFEDIMLFFEQEGLIHNMKKLPNRLKNEI
ncbi:MAG: hypothetical protein WDZ41_00480 [Candidatus Babeliales bacterium]